MWHKLLISELIELGYQQCSSDPCLLYKYVDGCSIPILIGVYVDDLIISVHRDIESVWLADKAALMSKYVIDDLQDINFCLKMKIERDRVVENRDFTCDFLLSYLFSSVQFRR
jgi:hypothetical protein